MARTKHEDLPLLQPAGPTWRACNANPIVKRAAALLVGVAIVILGVAAIRSNAGEDTLEQRLRALVDASSNAPPFSGVIQVSTKQGQGQPKVLLQTAMGMAHEEFDVPMTSDAVFPVASNSKLFTSVALYQLQERGLVNLSEPVNSLLTAEDFTAFGFPNQTVWCPRVAGAAEDSPCENMTFVQLLQMSSGLDDGEDCDIDPSERCHQLANELAIYKGSLAASVGTFINDPLIVRPGTNYKYTNVNFELLSYMIEKISGQPLEEYWQQHIFDKVGLKNTIYDPWSGQRQIHKKYVSQYTHYYLHDPANNASSKEWTLLSSGTCSPYVNSGAISGSGGIRSTAGDMHRWYLDLFHDQGRQSQVLSAASISMIVHRRNPTNPMYAQGIGVAFPANATDTTWPSWITYCGGMKCCDTCMNMHPSTDANVQSIVSSAFSNAKVISSSSQEAWSVWHPVGFMGELAPGAPEVESELPPSLLPSLTTAVLSANDSKLLGSTSS
ncbi:TPA: hypothetical protein N0F65_012144 [Lagenidium giganteum]|uniref:Beta-lactamase-related domain-containing protein n=1 Tax=Lagenidium giganteum TaxID=4803 RepID=A0AAV2YX55_9STRA|nr:TPA: hypothetical protein N0F65_012144 [Lagenidium giganteum]